MNLDICSNCLRKPSFYRIITIDDGYYILQGNTGCCLIAINQTEETEFLECIKLGKKVYRKEYRSWGEWIPAVRIQYNKEKDCFYMNRPSGPWKGEEVIFPFKTAEDFNKETHSGALGYGRVELYSDVYPLKDYFLIEKTVCK